MRSILSSILLLSLLYSTSSSARSPKNFTENDLRPNLRFTENKGQLHDQHLKPRPDVLFSGSDGKSSFFMRNTGISYQLYRVKSWKTAAAEPGMPQREKNNKTVPDQVSVFRIDMNWPGANPHARVRKENSCADVANYFTTNCGAGIMDVKSYKEIVYENLYPGIDLKWFEKDGHLKYDYIVQAGADYRAIQTEISGANTVSLTRKGELLIKTPLGNLVEQAPLVIQNGKELSSKWVLSKDNEKQVYILRFEIAGIDPLLPFTIDPVVRTWGTYYGGYDPEGVGGCALDASGNIYVCGATKSTSFIATTGAHQTTLNASSVDGFLAKFSPAGQLLWGTYYGGPGSDSFSGCATDAAGNIFLSGSTDSNTGTVIATPGSHQPAFGGVYDAFLVKFDPSGQRLWATYYGGEDNDGGAGVSVDPSGNVYLTGFATSTVGTSIATAVSHQTAFAGGGDAFLAKFNSSGVRQWGTYYGGGGGDYGNGCHADASGFVYVTGFSGGSSTGTSVATTGSHQTAISGFIDAFLVKFDAAGVRQWGTFYGNTQFDAGMSCFADASGNVYMTGYTDWASGNVLASSGAHQMGHGGNDDAFLVKFNSAGVRQWGTYYGGSNDDKAYSCFVNSSGDVLMSGSAGATTGNVITLPGNHQPVYGGGNMDAFLVKFNSAGVRQWGTYYGGASQSANEVGRACVADASGTIYMAGESYDWNIPSSGTVIATPGTHQSTVSGGYDAYLARFFDCVAPAPANATAPANLLLCGSQAAILSASSSGTVSWYATATGTNVLATGTSYTTNILPPGVHTLYASAFTCAHSLPRTAIVVTVQALPQLSVSVSSSSICAGMPVTLGGQGASTYTWNNAFYTPNITDSPPATTSYTLVGTSGLNGCTNTVVTTVTVVPMTVISAQSNVSAVCMGKSATLTASGNVTNFVWYPGSTAASSIIIAPTGSAVYSVTGGPPGCIRSATVRVSVYAVNLLTVQATSNPLCEGETATLSVSGALNYTWNSGESGPTITVSPASTTAYTVTGTDSNNCTASLVFTQAVDPCTGIQESDKMQTLLIYPNPFSSLIVLENTHEQTQSIQIVTALGQVVLSAEIKGKTTIDLSREAAGIYFLKTATRTVKLVKE